MEIDKAFVDPLKELDKNITIKFRSEGRTSYTYIIGLDDFVDDTKKFCKQIKKSLGTGSKEEVSDKGVKIFAFRGNFVYAIQKILIDNYGVEKDRITL